ncbi:unnamed protein product [Mycena citricolor]|uniref:DNA repair protein RAD50 n=1 Tax=Mycena citricolor TaxID=2018698 RepID=A0AAD2HXR3_9AGAR|nr:unnamed protein product [Mycena citricolor]
MANEKEVKAQVRLRFIAANGAKMVALRNLSVTVKKTGLTMKTLESVLALENNKETSGKRAVISTKCAELDAEIPQLLGVSKAVLENVIFCHQEDSYWPLAEPAALKKKFDDIFEATKYTKALDSIKSLRKDRVAELKAEKERLEGLSREKAHSDKLKTRVADLNKESANQFRDVYQRVESLEESKSRAQADLQEARINLQELPGTDEELEAKLNNSDSDLMKQRHKLEAEKRKAENVENELSGARKQYTELAQQVGIFKSEFDAQQTRLVEREQTIHDISDKFKIKGFSSSGLEAAKIVEFTNKIQDLSRKQRKTAEDLKRDRRAKEDEFKSKSAELTDSLNASKVSRNALQHQLTDKQGKISLAERQLEAASNLSNELRSLTEDIEEKQTRLQKSQAAINAAKYDENLEEKTSSIKSLEEKRDALNSEFKLLNLQAEARAKLDHQRNEVKSKSLEISSTLSTAKPSFRRLVGADPQEDTFEREVDRVQLCVISSAAPPKMTKSNSEREKELAEVESEASKANARLQQIQSSLSSLKEQLKSKKDELKGLDKQIKNGLELEELDEDFETVDDAITALANEVENGKTSAQVTQEGSKVYKELLRTGKQKKACSACNRHLDDHELMEFERVLQAKITKYSSSSKVVPQEEQDQWEALLKQVQALQPLETTRDRLKTVEIPELESKIQELNAEIPGASSSSDSFSEKLDDLKRDLREVQRLKMQGANISRLQKDLKRATENVATSEQQLSATGSTKTADEVQTELDELMAVIRKTEKQKEGLLKERETRMSATRVYENELHTMEIQSVDIRSKIREKESLEMSIQSMKEECQAHAVGVKEQDEKILELQAPIDALSNEHLRSQRELDADIVGAETAYSELAQRVDQLNGINKNIELYVRNKRDQRRQECIEKSEEVATEIRELETNLEAARETVKGIEKEINARGSAMATVRENLRVRRLIKEIKTIQENIDKEDIAAAAKAKRNFTEKFAIYKDKENRLQTEYAHMAGELSSSRNQLKQQELDLKEFKDVNKNYKDQLIKVKMSDMANNDLEKYAKALDNAIMKYHSLKMEEVNDIIKYLWNKTYQGSDIDTIRIRSDAEGGATKRSYNYRVVMTKDQVEMDMRGRCSAGQKMLASIIIRLALSDSFGQNCGILALDEPTNALDEKNIEALASSLISIIHERKSHSNFQLIVITHDEKFLAKLSQSGVLDYYWKMERDERQNSYITRKSVIEYH